MAESVNIIKKFGFTRLKHRFARRRFLKDLHINLSDEENSRFLLLFTPNELF